MKKVMIEIMKCKNCKAFALAAWTKNREGMGTRLTGHKCSGAWDEVKTFILDSDQLVKDIQANSYEEKEA